MNQHYARQGRFFPDSEGVQRAAETVSHADLAWFFQKYVAGTDEIPWDDFFGGVGLHLVRRTAITADPGFIAVRNFDTPPAIAWIAENSEAARAGLALGDSVLAIDGRPTSSDFQQQLAALHVGDTVHLKVRNGAGEHDLQWRLAGHEQVEYELKDVDNITPQQRARRAAWLKGESEFAGAAHP
jgi:predicted metalloprotease with PDZ domain